jgi:uncharacterized protein with HEPN domain
MSGKVRRTTEYLGHMLGAIHRINVYVRNLDRIAFDTDTRTQDAVIRNLEVIGEAARNIQQHDPDFVAAHPEVPWVLAYRMRNALSSGYACWVLPARAADRAVVPHIVEIACSRARL